MFVSDVRVVWALILKGVGITAGECITMWIDRVSHGPYFLYGPFHKRKTYLCTHIHKQGFYSSRFPCFPLCGAVHGLVFSKYLHSISGISIVPLLNL